jgi:P27 family predicted phage terminase small subunit
MKSEPPPPDDLTPELTAVWAALWQSDTAAVIEETDLPVVYRLFGLYAQHKKAADVVLQGLVVKGSVGQVRVNPLADHLLKLETAILRLENELGLTPMARARLGVLLRTEDDNENEAPSVIDEIAAKRQKTAAVG